MNENRRGKKDKGEAGKSCGELRQNIRGGQAVRDDDTR